MRDRQCCEVNRDGETVHRRTSRRIGTMKWIELVAVVVASQEQSYQPRGIKVPDLFL